MELSWALTGLPSAQHQAGLGGLLLVLQSMPDPPSFRLEEGGLTLTLEESSLARLLGYLFQGADRGKQQRPAGEWLQGALAPPWHAFWQDEVWFTLRPKAASRRIYRSPVTAMASKMWKALERQRRGAKASWPLSGSIMIGGREKGGEGQIMEAPPDQALLLHFAHAGMHPRKLARVAQGGSTEFGGCALVFPLPGDMRIFSSSLLQALRALPTGAEPISPVHCVSGVEEAGFRFLGTAQGVPAVLVAEFHAQRWGVRLVDLAPLAKTTQVIPNLRHLGWRAMACRNVRLGRPMYRGAAGLAGVNPSSFEASLLLDALLESRNPPWARWAERLVLGWLSGGNPPTARRPERALEARARAAMAGLWRLRAPLEPWLCELALEASDLPSGKGLSELVALARSSSAGELADVLALVLLAHSGTAVGQPMLVAKDEA